MSVFSCLIVCVFLSYCLCLPVLLSGFSCLIVCVFLSYCLCFPVLLSVALGHHYCLSVFVFLSVFSCLPVCVFLCYCLWLLTSITVCRCLSVFLSVRFPVFFCFLFFLGGVCQRLQILLFVGVCLRACLRYRMADCLLLFSSASPSVCLFRCLLARLSVCICLPIFPPYPPPSFYPDVITLLMGFGLS